MSLPRTDTIVTYPDGDLTSAGTVVHVGRAGDRVSVVLDRTAFHPVDPVWPDQPADTGVIVIDGVEHPVVGAVVGASDGESLYVGDAPVRTGTDGWSFVVCHLLEADADVHEGAAARVEVEAEARRALSAGHTACHLASLALNEALASLWSKEVPVDGRGNPDFDKAAITESRILPDGSRDTYRIGKSLRKKGFGAAELPGRLPEIESLANALLAGWVASGAPVAVVRSGTGLGERRLWRCELPDGVVEIPCGGTHLTALDELTDVRVSLEIADVEGGMEIRMATVATPA